MPLSRSVILEIFPVRTAVSRTRPPEEATAVATMRRRSSNASHAEEERPHLKSRSVRSEYPARHGIFSRATDGFGEPSVSCRISRVIHGHHRSVFQAEEQCRDADLTSPTRPLPTTFNFDGDLEDDGRGDAAATRLDQRSEQRPRIALPPLHRRSSCSGWSSHSPVRRLGKGARERAAWIGWGNRRGKEGRGVRDWVRDCKGSDPGRYEPARSRSSVCPIRRLVFVKHPSSRQRVFIAWILVFEEDGRLSRREGTQNVLVRRDAAIDASQLLHFWRLLHPPVVYSWKRGSPKKQAKREEERYRKVELTPGRTDEISVLSYLISLLPHPSGDQPGLAASSLSFLCTSISHLILPSCMARRSPEIASSQTAE
ncbi:hypothetical protein NMY22_g10754 [Coprinellus aureogranulatus]|nr:hypothetical protein NMY22_g10754 [Coprinellus aureogranulatus]